MTLDSFPEAEDFQPGVDLDLGNDHRLIWTGSRSGAARMGAVIEHLTKGEDHRPAGEYCAGGVSWTPGWREGPVWSIEGAADEHITLSPSVRCSCGDHGFIRDGKWVQA